MRIFIFFLIAFLFHWGAARAGELKNGDVLIISTAEAPLYSGAEEGSKTNSIIKQGRRVKAAGPAVRGFIPLATRSGSAWVREADVRTEAPSVDLVEPEPRRAQPTAEEDRRFPFGIKRVTFDLGGSFGQVADLHYTEINLGFNTYFSDYFAWRNALFGRFNEKLDNVYGLDTSLRGIFGLSTAVAGFTVFAGPGYRFVTKGDNVPLVEAGLVFRLAGISLGGGVKTLMTSWIHRGEPNDTQYFLILAGGGSL